MSLSRDVSNALDILGQAPGTVLVRGPDRWIALEPESAGLFLEVGEDGIPFWSGVPPPVDNPTDWQLPVFEDGWGSFGDPLEPVRYRKTEDWTVIIQGTAAGGSVSSNATIFTLPPEYRPEKSLEWRGIPSGGTSRVQVTSDGRIRPMAGSSGIFNLNLTYSIYPSNP